MSVAEGRYVADSKLGAGGMGEVWKAWDTQLSRWVALKFLTGGDRDEIARFKREAETAARLSHPNIAAVYDVGEAGGRPFIAMQLVAGATLRAHPRGDIRAAAALLRDAARAVHYAHSTGVIHRDIKPDNIMVEKGRAFVMDFGLARQVQADSSLTQSGMMIGTPAYMSPEQAHGDRATPQSDVYSLGATLYETVSGHAPFHGDSALALILKAIEQDPPPLPGELGIIASKAMQKDPKRRYAGAGAFADDLDRWLAGEPILARPPSVAYRLRKALVRRRGVVAAAALGVAGIAVALLVLVPPWLRASRDRDARQRQLEAAARARPFLDRGREFIREMERLYAGQRVDRDALRRLGDRAREELARALQEDPRGAEAHLEEARAWKLEGERARARRACDRAVDTDPSLVTARLERSTLLIEQYEWLGHRGRGKRAPEMRELWGQIEQDVAHVARWSGRDDEKLLAEAVRLFGDGRYSDAADVFLRYTATHPGDSQSWCQAAHALWHAGRRHEEALKAVDEAARLRPAWPRPYVIRGQLRHLMGRLAEAEADFNRGLELDPADAIAVSNRATLLHDLKRYADAERDYTRAIELEPDIAQHHNNRGTLLRETGRPAEAEADYARAIALDRDYAPPHYNRGRLRCEQKRFGEALADLHRAIELDPLRADYWHVRAVVHRSLKQTDEALADITRSIELDPDSAPPRLIRGNLLFQRRSYPEAAAEFTRAAEIDPKEHFAYYNRARVHYEFRRYEEAEADGARAIELAPDDAEAHVNRGNARRQLGRRADAEADYDRAIALNPGLHQAWENRGNLNSILGRWDRAAADWTKAVELAPHREAELRPWIEKARRGGN